MATGAQAEGGGSKGSGGEEDAGAVVPRRRARGETLAAAAAAAVENKALPSASPELWPVSVTFKDPELERHFRLYLCRGMVWDVRGFAAIVLVLWLALLVVDAARERSTVRDRLLAVRAGLLPVWLAVAGASFLPRAVPRMDALAHVSVAVAACLFLATYLVEHAALEVTSLALLVGAWDMFVGARFLSSAAVNAALFGLYQLVALRVPARSALLPLDIFFLSCIAMGLAVSRYHCRFQRSAFLAALSSAGQQISFHAEQHRAETLLLNVLPGPVAFQMLQSASPVGISERYDSVTILFADIVGFNKHANKMKDAEVVRRLNRIISSFDIMTSWLECEKIKTISTVYLAAGGLPTRYADHAFRVARLALMMQKSAGALTKLVDFPVHVMIGMATGPVVAGIIGTSKFSYDLWGDTVNMASRMESHGDPGRIQVTEGCYEALRGLCDFEERGEINVKGKGPTMTYWLLGITDPVIAAADEEALQALFDPQNTDSSGTPLVFASEPPSAALDQHQLAQVLDVEELAEDVEDSLSAVPGAFPSLSPLTLLFRDPAREREFGSWAVTRNTSAAIVATWALAACLALAGSYGLDAGMPYAAAAGVQGLAHLVAALCLAAGAAAFAAAPAAAARRAVLLVLFPAGMAWFVAVTLAYAADRDRGYPWVAYRVALAMAVMLTLPPLWFVWRALFALGAVVAYAAVAGAARGMGARGRQRFEPGGGSDDVLRESLALAGLWAAGSLACFLVDRHARRQFQLIAALARQYTLLQDQIRSTERIIESSIPSRVAATLKADQITFAESYLDAAILFSDICSFTVLSSKLEPREIVAMLNLLFTAFDQICAEQRLDKIKTIGDAYVVVGFPGRCAEDAILHLALGMQRTVARYNAEGRFRFKVEMRIGITAGPIIGGVIGRVRTFYDVWGQTLKTCERLEQGGVPGRVHVDEPFMRRLEEHGWKFEPRGGDVVLKVDDGLKRKEVASFLVIDNEAPVEVVASGGEEGGLPSPPPLVAAADTTLTTSANTHPPTSPAPARTPPPKPIKPAASAVKPLQPLSHHLEIPPGGGGSGTNSSSTNRSSTTSTSGSAAAPVHASSPGDAAPHAAEPEILPIRRARGDTRFARRLTVTQPPPVHPASALAKPVLPSPSRLVPHRPSILVPNTSNKPILVRTDSVDPDGDEDDEEDEGDEGEGGDEGV
jgi:class 3 adenylate cyclase